MNAQSPIPVGNEVAAARRDFRPFSFLQREIDRLFEDFAHALPASQALSPNMDVMETDKEIEITAELPGLEEKDVQVNLSGNTLTIKGEKRAEKKEKDKNFRLVERSYGSFLRSIELPAGVQAEKVQASLNKGVLRVSVPKPTAAQATKIDIKSAA